MKSYLLYLYTESPLHAGAPDSSSGIDLPIQREASTNHPVVWGQSLKGALRRLFREHASIDAEELTALFGSEPVGDAGAEDSDRETSMGVVAVGDAQLVALPVPTLQRTFAWVTSQLTLGRLARRYRRLGVGQPIPSVPVLTAADVAAPASSTWVPTAGSSRQEVLGPCLVGVEEEPRTETAAWAARLRDDVFGAQPDPSMKYFADKLTEDLLVVGDSVMSVLLRECMEHSVRIQLDPKSKTVKHGPFTSEYLPTDTVLAATLTVDGSESVFGDYLHMVLDGATWQVGGDETIGKGLVWSRLVKGEI